MYNNVETFEKYESEVRSYCRSFPVVFSKAKNAELFAEDGKRYIDFFCGAGALNYGHNNDYIKQRVIDYLMNDGVTHSLDMYTTAKRDFIEYFEKNVLIPRGLNYKIQFPAPTGTNGIEAALKLARKVKKRNNVFAFMGAFHGMTLGALSLTTDSCARGGAGVALNDVVHVPAPYMFPELDTISYIERLLTDDHSGIDKPAAIALETVQAEGGIYVFEVEWLQRLRKLCDKYDILMIVDDVQVGCGRTGTFFSFERANIVPDMVVLSKSIGGLGLPFALTLFKPELDCWLPAEHNGTFRGNQPAIVAAKAALEYMINEHTEQQAKQKGEIACEYIKSNILPINSKIELRAIGLAIGLDFTALGGNDTSAKIMRECFNRGVILERVGRDNAVVKIMPALTIEKEVLLEGLDLVKQSVAAVLGE